MTAEPAPGRRTGAASFGARGRVIIGILTLLSSMVVRAETLDSVQTLHRHLASSPRSLDPALGNDVSSQYVIEDMFEGLTTLDAAGRVVPGVAQSWTQSADGKTWIFRLRNNARWSDGQALTANDFVYAWRRVVDPALGAVVSQSLAPLANAMAISVGALPIDRLGVEATDAHTLVLHLVAPTSYLLDLLTNQYFAPVPRWVIERWGEAWTHADHMVCNGAFKLDEAVINGRIRLSKNALYWGADQVHLTAVDFIPLEDAHAAASQFLAGSIDFTDRFSMPDVAQLRAEIGDQVHSWPYFGTVMFGFNFDKPPFRNNPKLRQALILSIDRDIITRYVQHGVTQEATQLMPALPDYNQPRPAWAGMTTEARLAHARQLYKEAGYDAEHPLHILLSYPTTGSDQRRVIEAMSAMWRMNLGADVQIYNQQFKVLLQNLQMHQPLLYWYSWIGDYPDPFTYLQLFTRGFPQNYGDYDNPRFDALINQAQSMPDAEARFNLLAEAESVLMDDGAFLPVYYYAATHLIKPTVKGWMPNLANRNLSQYMYRIKPEPAVTGRASP